MVARGIIRSQDQTVGTNRFTKADVDYMVAEAKFIREIPVVSCNSTASLERMQAPVFSKAAPSIAIRGLLMIATVHTSPTGIPRAIPSSVLEWHGRRVRGVNYEIWHDNPDGTIIRGWHEHLWSPQDQDSYVIRARPEPKRKALRDLFRWGCDQWNIEILTEQLEAFHGENN